MSKSLEELLSGPEREAAIPAAISRAGERAEGAGLPSANLIKSRKSAWLEKDPVKLLELRRVALKDKKQQDEERRELHRQILKLMDGPLGGWIRQKAHEQTDKWERDKLCIPRYWVMWREWLAMPAPYLEAAVLRKDDLGVSMRQNSPFSHSFDLVDLVKPDIRKPVDGRGRSTEEMMFGAESRAAVSAAVWRAVERADALGLPRAYKELSAEVSAPIVLAPQE